MVSPALTLGLDRACLGYGAETHTPQPPPAALSLGLVEVATAFVDLMGIGFSLLSFAQWTWKDSFRDSDLVPVLQGYPAALHTGACCVQGLLGTRCPP